MTGLCGAVGLSGTDAVAADLRWTGEEATHADRDDDYAVHTCVLPGRDPEPVAVGDLRVWFWGSLYGWDDAPATFSLDTYRPLDTARRGGDSPARVLAERYAEGGRAALAGANGDFAAVIVDDAKHELSLVTDRLGTHDLYVTRPTPDTLLFSSRIQSLSLHPSVTPAFDDAGLASYVLTRRSYGVRTPLAGVERLPPGSVTTVDCESGARETTRYWRPRRRPVSRSRSALAAAFRRRFVRAVRERLPPGGRYGVLLSGGSDSRLILGAARDRDLAAYHVTGWMSRESRVAERVAKTADVPFHVLRRDDDFHARTLRTVPRLSNFVGRTEQAYVEVFADRLGGECDALVEGTFADTMFKGWPIPRREVSLGPLGTLSLPVGRRVGSVEAFRRSLVEDFGAASDRPALLRTEHTAESLFAANVRRTATGVNHHGIEYPTLDDAAITSWFVPVTTVGASLAMQSIRQHLPYRNPFLDSRLVDLALTIPRRQLVRGNPVDAALASVAPDLAAVPHAGRRVPLDLPRPLAWPAHVAASAVAAHLSLDEEPPAPHLTHGPWVDKTELLRVDPFVGDLLEEKAELLDSIPQFDRDAAFSAYRAHLAGANRSRVLYPLATILAMPVTERIAAATE